MLSIFIWIETENGHSHRMGDYKETEILRIWMNIHIIQNDFSTLNAFKLFQANISATITLYLSFAHYSQIGPHIFRAINVRKNCRCYFCSNFMNDWSVPWPGPFFSLTQTEPNGIHHRECSYMYDRVWRMGEIFQSIIKNFYVFMCYGIFRFVFSQFIG